MGATHENGHGREHGHGHRHKHRHKHNGHRHRHRSAPDLQPAGNQAAQEALADHEPDSAVGDILDTLAAQSDAVGDGFDMSALWGNGAADNTGHNAGGSGRAWGEGGSPVFGSQQGDDRQAFTDPLRSGVGDMGASAAGGLSDALAIYQSLDTVLTQIKEGKAGKADEAAKLVGRALTLHARWQAALAGARDAGLIGEVTQSDDLQKQIGDWSMGLGSALLEARDALEKVRSGEASGVERSLAGARGLHAMGKAGVGFTKLADQVGGTGTSMQAGITTASELVLAPGTLLLKGADMLVAGEKLSAAQALRDDLDARIGELVTGVEEGKEVPEALGERVEALEALRAVELKRMTDLSARIGFDVVDMATAAFTISGAGSAISLGVSASAGSLKAARAAVRLVKQATRNKREQRYDHLKELESRGEIGGLGRAELDRMEKKRVMRRMFELKGRKARLTPAEREEYADLKAEHGKQSWFDALTFKLDGVDEQKGARSKVAGVDGLARHLSAAADAVEAQDAQDRQDEIDEDALSNRAWIALYFSDNPKVQQSLVDPRGDLELMLRGAGKTRAELEAFRADAPRRSVEESMRSGTEVTPEQLEHDWLFEGLQKHRRDT